MIFYAIRFLHYNLRSTVNLKNCFSTLQLKNPLTMLIDRSKMNSILSPTVLKLYGIFQKHNYELRIAGGAVRDLLMGKIPQDLDFATTATPEDMNLMFFNEDVRMINHGGEKHGTITVRLDEQNFECTTLRTDLVTDGRHAEVEFTKDWLIDASRRDLTVNAMFLGLDGTVYDYFDGYKHLVDKKILFVGDPDKRIQEDYLRILRYFRFYGYIADDSEVHDKDILEHIKKNASGLERISGERIWIEVQKIMKCKTGGTLLLQMAKCNVTTYFGLPDIYNYDLVLELYKKLDLNGIHSNDLSPVTLLSPGFSEENDVINFIARIKCSKRERELLFFLLEHRDLEKLITFKTIQDLYVDYVIGDRRNSSIIKQYINELLKLLCKTNYINEINEWTAPKFPVQGDMVLPYVNHKGEIKIVLKKLLNIWKESSFELTASELIECIK